MDRVKFGRALGYGARHATKALVEAADAAVRPNPRASTPSPRRQGSPAPAGPPRTAAPRASRLPDAQAVRVAGSQAKRSLVAPVVRFSSVIWLQVTGVFFALIAFTMGAAAWRARAGIHAATNSQAHIKLLAYGAVFALFTYFTVSSFMRAARK